MTTVQWILCATDFSPAARAALEEALRLGALFRVEVLLLHVLPTPTVPTVAKLSPMLVEDATKDAYRAACQELDRLVANRSRRCVRVTARIELGPAAARILEIAGEQAGALVIVGTHSRDPLSRALLGGVATRIVCEARCPVLTVPARATESPRQAASIGRLCYATDFSRAATTAWPWAVAIAHAAGAEIDLLHVTPLPAPEPRLSAETLGKLAQRLHEEAAARADRFLQEHFVPGKRPEVLIVRGSPGEEILRWAEIRAADLTVMGTRGRSGLTRWVLGSVAHHVIQASVGPVLTVRASSEGGSATHGTPRPA